MGIIFALLTVACWSTATLSFTKASIIYEPAAVNKSRLVLAAVLLFVFILIVNGSNFLIEFSRLKNSHWLYFGLSGIIGLAIGDYFVFKAFRSIGSTYTTLISCASPMAAAISAYIFSGQNINIIGWLGMTITIGGIILVILSKSKSNNSPQGTKTQLIKAGFIYAFISAICQGLGLAITQMGRDMDAINMPQPYTIGLIRMLAATLIIIIADASRGKFNIFPLAPFKQNPKGIIYIIIGTISGPVIGVSCSIACLAYLPVAEAQTIFANLPLVVMLFNTIVGHEKPKAIIWLCLLLCIGGIIVLDLREDILLVLRSKE